MKKLNFLGIGPKIGAVALPLLAVAIFCSIRFRRTFTFTSTSSKVLFFAGIFILICGLIMYFVTVPSLLKGLKETRLVKTRAFYLCCNPLYSSIILFIIPGIAFIMNSWLVLTASVAGFILFKINIRKEYSEMEEIFGEEYREYRSVTPEFFPFPFKKWLS